MRRPTTRSRFERLWTMDDADRAEETIEQAMADALAAVRRAQAGGPRAVGLCLYCGEPLPDSMRFCDPDCRDAYDHERRVRMLAGAG